MTFEEFGCDFKCPVRASIFDDKHFTGIILFIKKGKNLLQSFRQTIFLVMGGNDDG